MTVPAEIVVAPVIRVAAAAGQRQRYCRRPMISEPEPLMAPLKLNAEFTASSSNVALLVTGCEVKPVFVTSCSTSLPPEIVVPPV